VCRVLKLNYVGPHGKASCAVSPSTAGVAELRSSYVLRPVAQRPSVTTPIRHDRGEVGQPRGQYRDPAASVSSMYVARTWICTWHSQAWVTIISPHGGAHLKVPGHVVALLKARRCARQGRTTCASAQLQQQCHARHLHRTAMYCRRRRKKKSASRRTYQGHLCSPCMCLRGGASSCKLLTAIPYWVRGDSLQLQAPMSNNTSSLNFDGFTRPPVV
jgi:hypothetical protein